ncbi:MAG: carbamoyltransferase [Isosphaeraceae bacterium]|nr:carbamoyltransferase [Isosphaeraceae bacterium]
MTAILGLSAFYHDSAAAIVVDGRIVAAAQEERFSRVKHDERFPRAAVEFCLRAAGLAIDEVDYVAYYEKPLAKFERLIETYLAFAPRGFSSFRRAIPELLRGKLDIRRTLARELGARPRRLVFVEHHESHAASAFLPSPFEEAAILTLDGVGEWATSTRGVGRGNRVELHDEIRFPHSLGLLYSAFTHYCGFKVNSGEYKLMGLAPYGRPKFAEAILEKLIAVDADGGFRLDLDYFDFPHGLRMTSRRFDALFGGPPRRPESRLEQRHMDLAASIQAVTEEVVLRIARSLHAETGVENLVMAGGVALNCVANGRLLREGPFRSIWVQPAAGDAGGALGAALFVAHGLLDRPRPDRGGLDAMAGALLGPAFGPAEINAALAGWAGPVRRFGERSERDREAARLLDEGQIVAVFQGRMEFGPRALGARSILGDPRAPEMQSRMNLEIKFRESFRPFAPCVLAERAGDWFDFPETASSPYMLVTAPVHEKRRIALGADDARTLAEDPDLIRRVNIPRSTIPAVTHVDQSARLQTVDARSPDLRGILEAFEARTGCPVLINTSFNVRGEPIVCTPEQAIRGFAATGIDALVLEDAILEKDSAARANEKRLRGEHLARYELD